MGKKIYGWYEDFKEISGRTKIVDIAEIKKNKYSINVALYVQPSLAKENKEENINTNELISEWKSSVKVVKTSFEKLKSVLSGVVK